MDYFLIVIWLLAVSGWLFYKWFSEKSLFFKKRGIKYVNPLPVFGNFLEALKGKESMVEMMIKYYNKFYNEK